MATVRALENKSYFTDNGVIGVAANQALDSADPLVKMDPSNFAPDGDATPRRVKRSAKVEQATAAPGEKRKR